MIVLLDYLSLYPNVMIGGNIFSLSQQWETYWQGSGVFASVYQNETDGIRGKYSRTRGKIEQTIIDLLNQRIEAKKNGNDRLALATKILINTIYGIMGSPMFKSVANIQGAGDCTAMARRAIKHARTVFEENGYECIYTDTDSIFINDTYNDIDRVKQIADEISKIERESFNVPNDMHTLEIECLIKRMYFFRDDKGEFIKKNYIYVTDEDKIVEKGLKIVKGNTSPVAKEVYKRWIEPTILDGTYDHWQPEDILMKLKIVAKESPEKFVKRYRVKAPETYKIPEGKEESTSLNYLLAKKYGGPNELWLVVNKIIGPGKGYHYCKLEELQEKYGDGWIDKVCYESYMDDLREFIWYENRNKIKQIDRRRV